VRLDHTYTRARAIKRRAELIQLRRIWAERADAHRDGYSRARAEFTELITAKPGERVAIKPPEHPFLLVAVPGPVARVFADDWLSSVTMRIAEFEFRRVAIVVPGRDQLDRVTLTWWVPEFRGVR
jgi:hypothetical protein